MDGPLNQSLKPQQHARIKFAAMAATYFAGALNDNFFKQSALILAVISDKSYLQGYATIVFTLPFVLFAAHAGFCADRFSKRSIVIGSKFLELAAMLLAAFAVYSLNWSLMILSLFILGLQATLFGPSLNGTIPEFYLPRYIPTANAIIKAITTGAILAGIAAAGFVLDIKGMAGDVPLARLIVACVMIAVSLIGLATAFAVPKFPAAAPDARFPWTGPLDSVKTLYHLRSDSLLAVAVVSSAFFWFIASLQILIVNRLGLAQLGLSATMTSMLVLIELAGIATGSLLSPRFAKGVAWHRVLAPSILVMAGSMFAVALVPLLSPLVQKSVVVIALAVLGTAGGLFFIPLASFVQIRPAPDVKGRIISATSFADFCGIFVSGAILSLFNHLAVRPSDCFGLMGIMVAIVAVWLLFVLPKGKTQ
jgi:acyl-[acyl-carrier-protein]-phospholipid O-acyltransferase/long-chain-fatty-acid--[acyl-carrier-protein] ligase